MGFFGKIFTWWDGATIGTSLFGALTGARVGEDDLGNVYYAGKKNGRRWVIYNGSNDASRVPPEWHSWLHRQSEETPDRAMPPARSWELPATGNLTGTDAAYRPAGALERGGHRARATGDYEAWSPDGA